jgi:cell division protein ZapA
MATVTVTVNGRAYSVGCEDGQEQHVASLARNFDSQVREVADAVGQVGDLRLFLMAALLTADEAADQRYRIEQLEAELERLRAARSEVEAVAARAIASTAARIEDLTARLEV